MLRKIFQMLKPKGPVYVTFRVEDAQAAQSLSQWRTQWVSATQDVENFLRERFRWGLSSKPDCPLYKLDAEGKVSEVHNNGAGYGFGVADGWRGIPGSQGWLVPDTGDAQREIDRLPRVPQKKTIYELIEWPSTLDPENEGLSKQEREVVRYLNGMVSIDETGTRITLPHPCNFADFSKIQKAMQDWSPPAWLVNVDAEIVKDKCAPQP